MLSRGMLMTSPAVKSCLCLLSAPPVEPGKSTEIHPDTAFRTADSGRRRGGGGGRGEGEGEGERGGRGGERGGGGGGEGGGGGDSPLTRFC